MSEKTTLDDIIDGVDIVKNELNKFTDEKEGITVLFLLICHFCSTRSKPKGELASYARRNLEAFDFACGYSSDTYSLSRFYHRKNLKGFLTPKHSQLKNWALWLKKAGFKDGYKGLDKLGGKDSEKAAMGFDVIQVIFCLSAKLNRKPLDEYVIDFITEYPNHSAWSRDNDHIIKLITNYTLKYKKEDNSTVDAIDGVAEELKKELLNLIRNQTSQEKQSNDKKGKVQYPKYHLKEFFFEEYWNILTQEHRMILEHIAYSLCHKTYTTLNSGVKWGGIVFWNYIYEYGKSPYERELFRNQIEDLTSCRFRTLKAVKKHGMSVLNCTSSDLI